MEGNRQIRCDAVSCKHNNGGINCQLESIKVCSCCGENCTCCGDYEE